MPAVGAALFAGFSTFGTAGAAVAGGIATAAGLGSSIAFSVGAFFATSVGRLLAGVAVNAISTAFRKSPEIQEQGLRTERTTRGSANAASVLFGLYSTEGNLVCPELSHGPNNLFHTLIIDLSDAPTSSLTRIALDNEWSDLGSDDHPEYGRPILSKRTSSTRMIRVIVDSTGERDRYGSREQVTLTDHAWVKFYDGTQAEADPMLLDKYGDHDERPWSEDMVGVGTSYAIVTLRFNTSIFRNTPSVRFEVEGSPLYDPRFDTSVGGEGAQRWNDKSTWEFSLNPMVQIYNIARGFEFPNGRVYGGGFEGEDLPLSNWFAAMNECDQIITNDDGESETQFTSGFEFGVDAEPAAVIEEIGKGCSAKFAEDSGSLMVRCGPAALPVMYFNDDDILIGQEATTTPFPALADVYNGARATFLDPESLWAATDAEGVRNEDLQAEDDGQERIANIDFTTVFRGSQVQRLLQAWVLENRRFERKSLAFGAMFLALQPLDVVGQVHDDLSEPKLYEIAQVTRSTEATVISTMLREADPADFTPAGSIALPSPISLAPVVPVIIGLENVQVSSDVNHDESGVARSSVFTATYDEDPQISGVNWVLYPQIDGSTVLQGTSSVPGVVSISDGVISGQIYDLVLTPIVQGSATPTLISGLIAATSEVVATVLDPAILGEVSTGAAEIAAAAAREVQENLDSAVDGLSIDYSATQQAAQSAETARDQAQSARDLAKGHEDAATAAQLGSEGARTQAQSAQAAAQAARDLANSSAVSAAGSASEADTSAALSATARDIAVGVMAELGQTDFSTGAAPWTSQGTASSVSKAPISEALILSGDPDFATYYAPTPGANTIVGPIRNYAIDPNKVYRLKVVAKILSNGTGANANSRFGVSTFNSDGSPAHSNVQFQLPLRDVAEGVYEEEILASMRPPQSGDGIDLHITASSADRGWFHYRFNYGNFTDATFALRSFEVEDVTSAYDAGLSASAAATSESQASAFRDDAQAASSASSAAQLAAEAARDSSQSSAASSASSASSAAASETAAGQSASAAQSSATGAATDASNASTSASDAATSASDAAGSSSTAASQASAAASSANNAGNSASASAASAQAAATSATDAGQLASAADSDRIAAQTARGGAEAAQTAAATSATDAAGSASSASTSSDLAVEARERAEFASAGVSNPGFEAAGAGVLGAPSGWMLEYAKSGADAILGHSGTVDGASSFSSATSFGRAQTDAGAWWKIGKRFETVPSQSWSVAYKVWLSSNGGTPIANGSNFVGNDDTFVHYIWYDANGAVIANTDTTYTAAYTHAVAHSSVLQQRWWRHGVSDRVAPANSAFLEIWIIAVDGNNSLQSTGRTNYKNWSSGNVAALIDDVEITSQNGPIFEVGLSAAATNASASAAASSASAASASENAAGQSATSATQSANTANARANAANTSANAAASSSSAAASSATDAAQSATSASGSANSASTSAGSASSSQTSAAQSATSASNSANAAAQSATVAATALEDFQLSSTDFQLILNDTTSPNGAGAVETMENGPAALGQSGTVVSATGAGTIDTAGITNGTYIEVPMEQALQFQGRRVRVDILARPNSTNPAASFKAAYSTSDNGNSGQNTLTLSSGWAWHSFYYDVPLAVNGGSDWIGLFGDAAQSGKKTQFARVLVRLASLADDIPEIGVVQSQATITQAAVADLEGNAAASIVLRTQAGSSGAALELVSADDPDGATSVARITADNILLEGSVGTDMLTVGLGRNMLSNTDFSDGLNGWNFAANGDQNGQTSVSIRPPGAWSGAYFPVLQIYQNSTGTTGIADLRYRPYVVDGVLSVGMSVEPGQWLEAGAQMSIHRCVAEVRIQYYDQTGASIGFSGVLGAGNDVSSSSTNPEVWPRYWGKHQAPANAAFATIHIRKGPTNSGSNSYVMIHKPQLALSHASATSPAPFSPGGTTLITGGKIATGSVTAADAVFETGAIRTADIGDLQVDTLKIKDQAVTIPVRSQSLTLHPLTATGNWVDIMTVVIDREGYSTEIMAGGDYHSITSGTPTGICGLRFLRDGVVINPQTAMVTGPSGSRTTWSMKRIDADLGTGPTTYKLQAEKRTDGSNTANTEIIYPWMTLHQFKR